MKPTAKIAAVGLPLVVWALAACGAPPQSKPPDEVDVSNEPIPPSASPVPAHQPREARGKGERGKRND